MNLIRTSNRIVVTTNKPITPECVVAERLTTGEYELFTIHNLNDVDLKNQKRISYGFRELIRHTYL